MCVWPSCAPRLPQNIHGRPTFFSSRLSVSFTSHFLFTHLLEKDWVSFLSSGVYYEPVATACSRCRFSCLRLSWSEDTHLETKQNCTLVLFLPHFLPNQGPGVLLTPRTVTVLQLLQALGVWCMLGAVAITVYTSDPSPQNIIIWTKNVMNGIEREGKRSLSARPQLLLFMLWLWPCHTLFLLTPLLCLLDPCLLKHHLSIISSGPNPFFLKTHQKWCLFQKNLLRFPPLQIRSHLPAPELCRLLFHTLCRTYPTFLLALCTGLTYLLLNL